MNSSKKVDAMVREIRAAVAERGAGLDWATDYLAERVAKAVGFYKLPTVGNPVWYRGRHKGKGASVWRWAITRDPAWTKADLAWANREWEGRVDTLLCPGSVLLKSAFEADTFIQQHRRDTKRKRRRA